jgi:hypothetical protein
VFSDTHSLRAARDAVSDGPVPAGNLTPEFTVPSPCRSKDRLDLMGVVDAPEEHRYGMAEIDTDDKSLPHENFRSAIRASSTHASRSARVVTRLSGCAMRCNTQDNAREPIALPKLFRSFFRPLGDCESTTWRPRSWRANEVLPLPSRLRSWFQSAGRCDSVPVQLP